MGAWFSRLKEMQADKPTAIGSWLNRHSGQPRICLYTGDKIHPSQWVGERDNALAYFTAVLTNG
jgi:hypothetical protein